MKLKGYFSRTNKFKLLTILPLLLLLSVCAHAQVGVVINEINYRSVTLEQNTEFIELYNTEATPVDLTGWQLTDGLSYQFPAGTSISAGGYLVVCANPGTCESNFGFSGAYGPFAGALSSEGDDVVLRDASFKQIDRVDYEDWKEWPNVRFNDYETIEPIPQDTAYTETVTNKVAISIQKINPNLDGKHGGAWGAATPTPNGINTAVFQSNYTEIPVIKSVMKAPDKPTSGELVRIKADFDNEELYADILSVNLEYQSMDAGSYITKSDTAYQTNWISIQMLDNGVGVDSTANNGVYTAAIPASVQQHRRLVRYRVKVTTTSGFSKIYPDQNHVESNYAYYVYDGHADFNGYNFNNINPMQDLTIITTQAIADQYIGNGTNNAGQYRGFEYLGEGTIVYNGKVYDHVRFRPRGKTRAPRLKPGVKFDMNSERKIQLLDDCGEEYDVPRSKLQLSGTWVNDAASHGLVESLVYKILELTGGMYKYNDYTSLRIVDRDTETGNDGDFWGLYLIQEDYNGDLLKEHNLPDGNQWATYDPPTGGAAARFLYIDSYGDFLGTQSQTTWISGVTGVNQTPDAATLDKTMFYGDWIANEFWANGESNYYGKHSYREYYNSETGLWIGWCKDYDGAFGSGNNNRAISTTATADTNAVIRQPLTMPTTLQLEYQGELRSAYDLLLNQEQSEFLVDSELKKIYDPNAAYDWVDVNTARWDTLNSYPEANIAEHFQFYKNWFQSRANYLLNDTLHGIADLSIPNTPTISLTGSTDLDNLTFSNSAFEDPDGNGTFAALEWRVGEWSDPSNLIYADNCEAKYEIETKWKSGEITTFNNNYTIPADAQLKIGRTYKFRVRYKDNTGRWSHWSSPIQIIPTPASNTDYDLVINEIMYNDGGDCCGGEYIEIYNAGNSAISLNNFKFTEGIDYDFPKGTSIAADGYVVLAKDSTLFTQKYGFAPFGDYKKTLTDGSEDIILEGPYRVIVDTVRYNDDNGWDEHPDGNGTSLELLDPTSDNANLLSWFRSDVLCGTPGAPNTRVCTSTAESIVINEINYNSDNGVTDPGDWVELYNPGAAAVDISGWEFYNNDTIYTIPVGTTIGPDDYLVLAEDMAMFSSIFPHLTTPDRYIGGFSFGLSGKGERISLFDANKCLADYVDYDDETPWTVEPDGNGPTLSLATPNSDNALPQSWESSSNINSAFGTPGRANEPCRESNIMMPEYICTGVPTTFTMDTYHPDATYTWFFLGGSPISASNTDSVEVTFATAGTKTVRLIMQVDECQKVLNYSVNVDCIVTDTYDTPEDITLNTNISGAGNGTTTTLVSDVSNGTLNLNPDGSFDYAPDADYYGTDQFIYETCIGDIVLDTTINTLIETLEVQVANGSDDVEENSVGGTIVPGSSDLDLLVDNPQIFTSVGIRMLNVSVPSEAIITSAYLQFTADESQSIATNISINAEQTGNAPALTTTPYSISSKTRTNASATWNPEAWTVGNTYTSADITTVVQELINRGDWANGNAMTFILEGTGTRTAESYDGSPAQAPKLFINYEVQDTVITVVSDDRICATSIIDINVTPVNDNPIAIDDIQTTSEDNAIGGDVLPNDSDLENNTLSVNTTPVVAPANGNLALNADGTYIYTPDANFNGTDTFEYEVCDNGSPTACDTASVTITVDSVNDAPVAFIDIYSLDEDGSLSNTVLINDTDIENDNLTVTAPPLTPPTSGTLTLYANGTFDYVPNANFYGFDTFEYEVCDDGTPVECATASVNINIIAINDAPIAVNDVVTTPEETSKSGNIIANDINVDGDNLTANINLVTQPTNGNVFVLASGLYSYTPDADFTGTDTFEYEVCDDGNPVLCDTAMVSITVENVNDAPLATADTFYMVTNTMLQTNLLTNDMDLEDDSLTIVTAPASEPASGTLNMQPNGDIDYTPTPGYTGTITFSYEVCDDGTPIECTIAEVTVIVELDCINIQVFAWMEGAYDPNTFEMRNTLNVTRSLLPGQTPISNLATPTPAGQPYSIAPWNYTGTEGITWTDADYIPTMVDWVLLSFRTDTGKDTEIAQTAGIINQDGSVTLVDRCGLEAISGIDSLYILLEHRNHMGIMTPEKIEIVNGTLTYDFRTSDSFRDITSFGQKQLPTGEWAMYAGDVNQITDVVSYDINGQDKSIWVDDNGIFDNYLNSDFNLDGDVNGGDKTLWFDNNGISSRVPK